MIKEWILSLEFYQVELIAWIGWIGSGILILIAIVLLLLGEIEEKKEKK